MSARKRGEMELALVTFGCDIITSEPVRREPLVWITSARHSVHLLDTLPLASPHCEWRTMVLRALESQKRKYRIAYSSSNSNVINAAVQAGLAVGAVPQICVRPGLRVLTEKDGFPDLGLLRNRPCAQAGPAKFGGRSAGAPCHGKSFDHAAGR